jgi:hypothetical protein
MLACESKSETQTSTADAGVEKPAGKVEQALANAVRAGANPAAAASAGPPADGVMDAVRAETEVPSGSAPKLTLGNEGSGKKALLRNATATLPRTLTMEMAIQAGMDQGLPPITVSLVLEGKKGKKADEATSVTAKVRDIKVAMPNVPQEFTQQLAGLKGGKVTFSLSREGGGFGFVSELAAGAKPELRDLLESVSEGLAILTGPTPAVPVGQGAFWMVASREVSGGFGLLSYRMVKVLSVTDKGSELEFDARRYAVGRAVDPTLLPPGSPPVSLREMAAASKAKFSLSPDSVVATTFEGDAAMRGAIDDGAEPMAQGQQGKQPRMVQAGTGYRITIGK